MIRLIDFIRLTLYPYKIEAWDRDGDKTILYIPYNTDRKDAMQMCIESEKIANLKVDFFTLDIHDAHVVLSIRVYENESR